jgi:hypothetical protein
LPERQILSAQRGGIAALHQQIPVHLDISDVHVTPRHGRGAKARLIADDKATAVLRHDAND